MCFMDWRIGRLIRSTSYNVITDANGFTIISPNQQRVGITVWGVQSQSSFLITDPSDTTGPTALVAVIPQIPVHITVATHGDLPMRGIRICSGTESADRVYVTEYCVPEDVLQLGLEQIRNQYPI